MQLQQTLIQQPTSYPTQHRQQRHIHTLKLNPSIIHVLLVCLFCYSNIIPFNR